jgi:hypothetical protein
MARRKTKSTQHGIEAADIKQRLRQLCESDWDSNLKRMAEDLHLQQPALWKMVAGEQPPNAQLLIALAEHTALNLHWLITGQGPRYLKDAAAVLRGQGIARPRLPVVRQVLPGPPEQHRDLWMDQVPDVLEGIFTPTQYWLELSASELIVGIKEEEIRAGDWLLMEGDKARFPPQDKMEGQLVVAMIDSLDGRTARLARVSIALEGDNLDVDIFHRDIDPATLEEEIVVRTMPGGKLRAFKRQVACMTVKKLGLEFEKRRPVKKEELLPIDFDVKRDDLLAVCILTVRRR